MALTNICGQSPALRDRAVSLKAWEIAREGILSNNPQLQRAAVQTWTNLVTSPAMVERLASRKKGKQDLCILLMFATNPEDVQAQLAATGALAMLCGAAPHAARAVGQVKLKTNSIAGNPNGSDGAGTGDANVSGDVASTSTTSGKDGSPGLLLLKALTLHPEVDEGVKARCAYAVEQIEKAEEENANARIVVVSDDEEDEDDKKDETKKE